MKKKRAKTDFVTESLTCQIATNHIMKYTVTV